MTICGSFEICSYKLFYMVIQTCNSLFKASLEEKNEKQKKEGWLAGIFFSISDSCLYLVSMKTHQCFFACLTYLIIMA